MTLIDKINTLKKLDKAFFTTGDLKKCLGLKADSLKKTLGRMAKKGIIKRLTRGVYILSEKGLDSKRVASQLYAPYAYVSFETALSMYSIIDQIPYVVTMATCKSTKSRPFFNTEIMLRRLKKELFFGYVMLGGFLVAEPEKALLDTLYMKSKGLASLNEEELNLGDLFRTKFLKMSKSFPEKVQQEAKCLAQKMRK